MPRVLGEIDELHFFLRYLLALSRDAEVWGRCFYDLICGRGTGLK